MFMDNSGKQSNVSSDDNEADETRIDSSYAGGA